MTMGVFFVMMGVAALLVGLFMRKEHPLKRMLTFFALLIMLLFYTWRQG